MTEWGMLLLCAYIALGATGRLTWRQAGRVALALTAVVITVAVVSYKSGTPTDQYIPSVDATVYKTGNPFENTGGKPTSEDQAGAAAASWLSTDHSYNATASASSGGGN
jgi:Na+(H+)/acetate symporter ActP